MRLLSVSLLSFCIAAGLLSAGEAAPKLPPEHTPQPLHQQIDRLLASPPNSAGVSSSPRADDAEFLRRAYLDFAGRVPSHSEARAFLADASPNKRAALVDRLLAGPDFPRRMAEALNVQLMERLGDDEPWMSYLRKSLADGRPLDEMARHMLSPDPDAPAVSGAGFFLSKRLENFGQNPVDYPALTRDVGRLMLGVDLQCAQCHNHLFISDYRQEDFQGLFAFVRNAYLHRVGKTVHVAEKPAPDAGKLEFASVFDQVKHRTGPKLPGAAEVAVPTPAKGQEWEVAPDKKAGTPGVPKVRLLAELASRTASAENRAFARNWANRLWLILMGRGIVHPPDLHHTGNPPAQPVLLDRLTDALIAAKFDVRAVLREIALTEAYQRSSRLPTGPSGQPLAVPAERFATGLEKRLAAEQLGRSVLQVLCGANPLPADDAKLSGDDRALLRKFAAAFNNPPREPELEFAPSLKATLFLLNDEGLRQRLLPAKGRALSAESLPARLAELLRGGATPDAVAEELYLSVVSRPPSAEDRRDVAEFATARRAAGAEPAAIAADLIWALLASPEFTVNH